jgi:hypothetical protein
MPNLKTIDIDVDTAIWNPNPVPQDIQALSRIGSRLTDVDCALIHTALWTRPPNCFGFSLSDCWAWLRYQRAISTTSDLRLRKEWDDIDPHQKTVLSDELGVGFATQLLTECLGFQLYADTQFLVSVLLPGIFTLGRYSKCGHSKSPDYIAIDNNLQFNVVECKGTQSSPEELDRALQRGVSQKSNLSVSSSSRIKHSLVAGLYIPKWSSPYPSTIRVRDPSWEEMNSLISKVPEKRLLIGIIQISLAKHFALMGLLSLTKVLSSTKGADLEKRRLPDAAWEDSGILSTEDHDLSFETKFPLPVIEQYGNDPHAGARFVRFRMDYPKDFYEEMIKSRDVAETFYRMGTEIKEHKWTIPSKNGATQLTSPLGFKLSLEFIY